MANAITKQQVYQFRKGSLIVFFRLYLDRRKFNAVFESEARDGQKSGGFDSALASKLLQKEMREGMSELKISGAEQIIIDLKSIKVMNEMDSIADTNTNDIRTGGIASGSKALAPIKSTKDTKLLSDKSKSNIDDQNQKQLSSTLPSVTPNNVSAQTETGLKSTSQASTSSTSSTASTALTTLASTTNTTNTTNAFQLISSTLSPFSSPTTSHSSTTLSSLTTNKTEVNAFVTNKTTNIEIKSSTVPPKTEKKNPFLPFTRRQSTATPITSSTPPSTSFRITTRSRLRSTTYASTAATTSTRTTVRTTTTTSTTTTSTTTTPLPVSDENLPNNSPQLTINGTNVLLKRTEIREEGLRPPGLDFGQWRPVVTQSAKPPRPTPPSPIPPPIRAQRPPMHQNPPFPHNQSPPNQLPPNLIPMMRPPHGMPHIPQPVHNRPSMRIPIPIGIPMREVPRLLDDRDDEESEHQTEGHPKEIERHNTSIIHTPIKPWINNTTPIPSTTSTPISSLPTRGSRFQSTSSDPSMVDGFLVPISVQNFSPAIHSEPRRNKSFDISDDSKWDFSSDALPPLSDPQSYGEHIEDLSIDSPIAVLNKPLPNTSEQTAKPLIPNSSQEESSSAIAVSQASNTVEPTLNSNLSLDSAKTKTPFDYYSVINESLISQTESTANITSPFSVSHQTMPNITPDTNTRNPPLRPVTPSTPIPEMMAGVPLGIINSDILPAKLIRPIDSSEPVYGERLPKYIPPALYNSRHPSTNDIISSGIHTPNEEEMADEALYDDEISPIVNNSDILHVFPVTTTTSHRFETTTTVSSCLENEFQCSSGECIPAKGYCNRRIECSDSSDESQCTCAYYLKAERQFKKICDGVVDCYDMSDESDCSYCKDSYVCAQSHVCIDISKVCNGENDCPSGDDESECISLVPNDQTLDTTGRYLNSEGTLYIRREGEWAPLCMDDIKVANDLEVHRMRRSDDSWKMEDLGRAICRANSYSELESVRLISLNNHNSKLFFKLEEHKHQISPSLSM